MEWGCLHYECDFWLAVVLRREIFFNEKVQRWLIVCENVAITLQLDLRGIVFPAPKSRQSKLLVLLYNPTHLHVVIFSCEPSVIQNLIHCLLFFIFQTFLEVGRITWWLCALLRTHWVFLNREYACLVAHVCQASCFRSESRILPAIRKTKSGTG